MAEKDTYDSQQPEDGLATPAWERPHESALIFNELPDDIKEKIDNDLIEDQMKDVQFRSREKWTNALDFLVACVGFSVGLGNVWRFPYLCYTNGGGAFLLPYLLCVVVGGVPLFYLEVTIGQLMSVSGVRAWNICPIFKGIGFATFVVVFTLNCYYNVVIGWALYYMFASFTSTLPWGHCGNAFNTPNCTTNVTLFLDNGTIWTDSVTEFWERKVLGLSAGIEDMGILKWDVSLCLLLAWVIVYLCICKGIRTSGKVMYVTALTPYVLLITLLIRGATLEGSMSGIIYFLKPEFSKLASLKVWVDAGTQIFFSYSIALGSLTAIGSYNRVHHNSYRDAIIFSCTNSGTSLLSGFVIFSVLGHMSHERNIAMEDVAEKGPGLTFIVYPRALMEMFAAPAWSVIFFFTILLLGIDSQFVQVEGVVSSLVDQWPKYLRRGYRREILILLVCVVTYLIGLSMCTQGGMYIFQLFDHYGGSKIILLIGFFECLAVAWVYGIKRFYKDIEYMLGFRISPYMYICWTVLSPLFCLVLFVMSMSVYSELTYERGSNVYVYPPWAVGIGWLLVFSSIIFLPIVAAQQVYKVKTADMTIMEAVKKACEPVGIDYTRDEEVGVNLSLKKPPPDIN